MGKNAISPGYKTDQDKQGIIRTVSEAILIRTDLNGAHLKSANLRGVNLFEAVLGKSFNPLTGALTIATDLTEADLSGANLNGTNFNGANLTNAKVSPEQLTQVKPLKGATMPDGSIPPWPSP